MPTRYPSTGRRTQPPQLVELQLPPVLTWSAGRIVSKKRGTIRVLPAGKPPKLRFRPGSFISLEERPGRVRMYEVIYAFRINERSTEWIYCCEMRQELRSGGPNDPRLFALVRMGLDTPRVVCEVFHDRQQAWTYFAGIPIGRDRKYFTNRQLMRSGAEVVSSGEVL